MTDLRMACGHGDFWGYAGETRCTICDELLDAHRLFWCQVAICALLLHLAVLHDCDERDGGCGESWWRKAHSEAPS